MKGVLQFIDLIGGLGVFLVGMRLMSDGIQKRAGHRLKSVLHTMTENRFAGVLTGLAVTSLIQSSSATTVILVSLVNAGVVTLRQSIGVIMGANIGTTLTAWIVSLLGFRFKIADIALPAIAIALPLYFSGRTRRREVAEIFIGFGLLFLGLGFMKDAVPDIQSNPEVLQFLSRWSGFGFRSTLLFVVIGTILTIVVQSSSAAMTITITMAYKGWIDFPVAAAIVLGENIGTTITAFLASLPMNAAAKRAARSHMAFNIIGVFWMLAVFGPFTRLVDWIVPGSNVDQSAIPFHLSMFHTLFNLSNTLLLIGFVGPLSRLVVRMVKDGGAGLGNEPYRLRLVPANIADAVDSNLITIRGELAVMAGEAHNMLLTVMNGTRNPRHLEKRREELELREQRVDDMQEQIVSYLTECTRQPLGVDQSATVAAQMRIAHEIETIADSSFGIGLLVDRMFRKNLHFHQKGRDELMDYTSQVLDFLRYNQDYLARKLERYEPEVAHEMEDRINRMRDRLRRRSRRVIEKDEDVDVRGELVFMDIVRHLEHIGDSSLNVSQAVVEFL